jgi:hypothetical protein
MQEDIDSASLKRSLPRRFAFCFGRAVGRTSPSCHAVRKPPRNASSEGGRTYLGRSPSRLGDRTERTVSQSAEPPCTDPYARWCGRGGAVRLPPIPIARTNRQLCLLPPKGARPRSNVPPTPRPRRIGANFTLDCGCSVGSVAGVLWRTEPASCVGKAPFFGVACCPQ